MTAAATGHDLNALAGAVAEGESSAGEGTAAAPEEEAQKFKTVYFEGAKIPCFASRVKCLIAVLLQWRNLFDLR